MPSGVTDAALTCRDEGSRSGGQCSADLTGTPSHETSHIDVELTTEHRSRECVTWIDHHKVGARLQIQIEVDVDRRIEFTDGDFARGGNTAFRAYRGMIINDADGPSGTCGAAARLPNRPGSHMLMPPSSARASCEVEVMAARATANAATRDRPNGIARIAQRPRVMIAPVFAVSALTDNSWQGERSRRWWTQLLGPMPGFGTFSVDLRSVVCRPRQQNSQQFPVPRPCLISEREKADVRFWF